MPLAPGFRWWCAASESLSLFLSRRSPRGGGGGCCWIATPATTSYTRTPPHIVHIVHILTHLLHRRERCRGPWRRELDADRAVRLDGGGRGRRHQGEEPQNGGHGASGHGGRTATVGAASRRVAPCCLRGSRPGGERLSCVTEGLWMALDAGPLWSSRKAQKWRTIKGINTCFYSQGWNNWSCMHRPPQRVRL